jgi:hypothetical protein
MKGERLENGGFVLPEHLTIYCNFLVEGPKNILHSNFNQASPAPLSSESRVVGDVVVLL